MVNPHAKIVSLFLLIAVLGTTAPARAQGPFPDAHDSPPAGWTGPVFKLRQDYPPVAPTAEGYPWKAFDFKTQSKEYIESVLGYCFDGNTDPTVDWQLDKNAVRDWYHAPWMHAGDNGREFIHGLTQERRSPPGDLHPNQTQPVANWAVSAYNAPGGYIIGQVWKDPLHPDASVARFPDGTVSVKLLFTGATDAPGPTQVPFLKNAKAWKADINRNAQAPDGPDVPELRLLQIDVAVRETRADTTTGWVFGTFIYDGDAAGATSYDRMVPVGIMWGNDPGVTPAMVGAGTVLRETWLNPDAAPLMVHNGWAGRLDGPVNNRLSSCLSCHSTAETPAVSPILPPSGSSDAVRLNWFRNLFAGDPFDTSPDVQSLDYSLQLSTGIQRFHESTGVVASATVHKQVMQFTQQGRRVFPVARDERELTATPIADATPAKDGPEKSDVQPLARPAPVAAWTWVPGLIAAAAGGLIGIVVTWFVMKK